MCVYARKLPPATATRCLVPEENCGRAFWHRIPQRADRTELAADAVFKSPGGLTRMLSIICDRCAEYDALPLFAASFSLMSPRLGRSAPAKGQTLARAGALSSSARF